MKAMYLSLLGITLLAIISSGFSPVMAGRSMAQPQGNVSVAFDGMELLCTGDEGRVTVGLLDAMDHAPRLVVTRVSDQTRAVVATLEGEAFRGSLIIDVEGSAYPVNFHQSQDRAGDAQDWRWVIGLEELFPGRKLTVREDRFFGKVHFLAGTFHAAKLSDKPARFFAADGKGKALPFKRRVAAPAMRLDLNAGEVLLLRTERDTLRFEVKDGVRYEVTLTNLPPPDKASFDHFLHYFDVIEEKLPRYVPFLLEQVAFDPSPSPCAPIYSSSRTRFP